MRARAPVHVCLSLGVCVCLKQIENQRVSYVHIFYQGWDSSAFTWISVQQKLKSVVDDDDFRGFFLYKNPQETQSNLSPYLTCPHSVVFSSYSWMCTRPCLTFHFLDFQFHSIPPLILCKF